MCKMLRAHVFPSFLHNTLHEGNEGSKNGSFILHFLHTPLGVKE